MKHKNNKPVPLIIITSIAALVILVSMVDVKQVDGRSMEPYLEKNRTVLICRAAYGLMLPFTGTYLFHWSSIQPGDIIVYKNPASRERVVKQCVAVGGDPFELQGNVITFNTTLRGPAADPPDKMTFTVSRHTAGSLRELEVLPEGCVFAVGVNLEVSVDSRHYGCIPHGAVIGRVVFPVSRGYNSNIRAARGK